MNWYIKRIKWLKFNYTCTSPPPGWCSMLSLDPTFGSAFSLKSNFSSTICTSPPPGWCFILSLDPTFDAALALKSTFTSVIFTFPPPGLWSILSLDPTLEEAFSLKSTFSVRILTFPPPGLWSILSFEPTLELALSLKSSLRFSIWRICEKKIIVSNDVVSYSFTMVAWIKNSNSGKFISKSLTEMPSSKMSFKFSIS